jgi:hypothetical protein
VGLLDAAQHDRLMDPIFLEGLNQLAKLADLDPMDPIYMAGQFRFRFAFMRDGRDVVAQLPGIIREDDRESAVAGDQPNPFAIEYLRR